MLFVLVVVFLIYAFEHIWKNMDNNIKYKNNPNLKALKSKIALKYIYGINKELDLVKICKAYMLLIGNGKSNIVQTDSLKVLLNDFYNKRAELSLTETIRENGEEKHQLKKINVVLTNPPFSYTIKVDDNQS